MPYWLGSDRRARLPADWPYRRARVLRRDGYRCTALSIYGERCELRATDVDHIKPGDDHRETNLASLCTWHHRRKSGAEGAAAAQRNRTKAQARFRRNETHPGRIEE
jgi:5-methylcytosine-specific restriction enzyme A